MTGILIGNLIGVVVRLFTGPLVEKFIDMVLDFMWMIGLSCRYVMR